MILNRGDLVDIYEYKDFKVARNESERHYNLDDYERHPVIAGAGYFQEFGVDYKQLEMSCGTYSIAIVMLENGSLKNVALHMIRRHRS